MKITRLLVFISLFLLGCLENKSISMEETTTFMHIDSLIKYSRNSSLSDSLRKAYLKKAVIYANDINHDSLKTRSYIRIAYSYRIIGNIDEYKRLSQKSLKLSTKNNDSLNIASSHGDLGQYYQYNFKNDSAFYYYKKALDIYRLMNLESSEGDMLLSMATVQSVEKDYIGSEINTYKALEKYNQSNSKDNLFLCYNNLAYISNLLTNYDESIAHRQEALKYLSKDENSEYYYLMTINGIGTSYQDKGDYEKSIEYFNEGMTFDNIQQKYPLFYARFMDNIAFSNLQIGNESQLPEQFFSALSIRDGLQDISSIIQSNINLTKYYLYKKEPLIARNYALKAKDLSKQTSLNSDLLQSYHLLSKIETGEKGKEYLFKHIQLTDSLQHAERITREKFTRIAYETDEILQEKEVETKRKWWLASFLGLSAVVSGLIFLNMHQRSKNKDLKFNQVQEEANIEIYNLMIAQQQQFQEGSNEEKKRISEELHDGVLGRLFGTRLSLDSLNDGNSEKDIEERENYIEELQFIEEDIRKISHNLSNQLFSPSSNFVKMVEELVEKQSKISKFDYQVMHGDSIPWDKINNKIKIHCYRTFQEALQNINKYANASKVEITFNENSGKLLIDIKDNGIGFDIKKKSKGIGINNIISRVERLQGTVKFISSINNGTLIKMSIPIS